MTIRRITVIETLIVTAMSCAAAYTFYMSFAYPHMKDTVADIPQTLGTRTVLLVATLGIGALCAIGKEWLLAATWAVIMLTLSELVPLYIGLGASLTFLGMLLVIRAALVWGFLGILFAFYFPSLMAFSSADWFWSVPDLDWEAELNSASMAALFGFLIVGHLALRYTTQSKRSRTELLSQGFDATDIEALWAGKLSLAVLVLVGASLITTLILVAAIGLDRVVGGHVGDSPIKPVLAGIGGSAILIAAVYYVLVGRRTA